MKNNIRLPEHQKPVQLEEQLKYFEKLFTPVECKEVVHTELCNEPIIYIMGCARSGTTLIYQYLSHCGLFTYPTNFISRFYYSPLIGARLQEMLIHSDFNNEIFPANKISFESRLGKTMGALAPHEFWYFWKQFLPVKDTQKFNTSELNKIDKNKIITELRAFQSVKKKPLLLKGMILNWNIPFLSELYQNTYFIYVKRSIEDNAASLLNARKIFFGDTERWYSFKPDRYQNVLSFDPISQCVWQVIETNTAIEQGLKTICPSKIINVDYESFCKSPSKLLNTISETLNKTLPENAEYLPKSFKVRSKTSIKNNDIATVIKKIKTFTNSTRSNQGAKKV